MDEIELKKEEALTSITSAQVSTSGSTSPSGSKPPPIAEEAQVFFLKIVIELSVFLHDCEL